MQIVQTANSFIKRWCSLSNEFLLDLFQFQRNQEIKKNLSFITTKTSQAFLSILSFISEVKFYSVSSLIFVYVYLISGKGKLVSGLISFWSK